MSRNIAVVLMTALVPTIGHRELINFAKNLPGVAEVNVIISLRGKEPVPFYQRIDALQDAFYRTGSDYVHILPHIDDDAPQNDPEDPEESRKFWDYWRNVIFSKVQKDRILYTVSSEPYGKRMAEEVGAKFVPYDIERAIYPVKGTPVRENIYLNWDKVLPEFRRYYKKTFVMFGQESVGKTTMSRTLARDINGGSKKVPAVFVPEYARPYLEQVGSELTDEKMKIIARGQYAYQTAVATNLDVALQIQDTDLLSTIGYYRIWGKKAPQELIDLYFIARARQNPFYFLMPDQGVPFEADQLRYGGDKRESTYQFWKDLLMEFETDFHEVPALLFHQKKANIATRMEQELDKIIDPMKNFIRE